MDHSEKMVLKPMETDIEPPVLYSSSNNEVQYSSTLPSTKKTKNHPLLEKLTNQIKIILKLAKIDAYDNNLRIKNEHNEIIDNSNIINLLQNVTTPARVIMGLDAFVYLMYKAGVEPELISNENIKIRLQRLYETNKQLIVQKEPIVYSTKSPFQDSSNAVPVIRQTKRKLDDIEEIEEATEPKRISTGLSNWLYPPIPDNDDDI